MSRVELENDHRRLRAIVETVKEALAEHDAELPMEEAVEKTLDQLYGGGCGEGPDEAPHHPEGFCLDPVRPECQAHNDAIAVQDKYRRTGRTTRMLAEMLETIRDPSQPTDGRDGWFVFVVRFENEVEQIFGLLDQMGMTAEEFRWVRVVTKHGIDDGILHGRIARTFYDHTVERPA